MSVGLALAAIALGLGVGALSALFGVGGGVIMVPFIVLVLEKTQHVAEGTSLAVIVPTAIVGVLAHRRTGYVSGRTIAWLGAGGVAGAIAGARAALVLEGDDLGRLFALVVVFAGVRLIVQGARQERGSTSEGSPPESMRS
jgi:uncharacterized membrane protein YfcA